MNYTVHLIYCSCHKYVSFNWSFQCACLGYVDHIYILIQSIITHYIVYIQTLPLLSKEQIRGNEHCSRAASQGRVWG